MSAQDERIAQIAQHIGIVETCRTIGPDAVSDMLADDLRWLLDQLAQRTRERDEAERCAVERHQAWKREFEHAAQLRTALQGFVDWFRCRREKAPVKQAEALLASHPTPPPQTETTTPLLREADTETPPPATCDWKQETDHDCDYWDTACGEAFQFNDGGPRENKMQFCPYCGRAIAARRARAEDGERHE